MVSVIMRLDNFKNLFLPIMVLCKGAKEELTVALCLRTQSKAL